MNLAPPPPFPVRPRPVSGLGIAAIVLLGFALLPYALRIVVSWLPYRVTIVVLDGNVSTDTRQPDILSAMLLASNVLLVPAVLAATVTALGWIHRAHANASVLSPHLRLRHTPGSAVGLLLIPVANIWYLRTVLTDLWAGSSPYGHDERGARLIGAFWGATVGAVAVFALGQVAEAAVTAGAFGVATPLGPSVGIWVAVAGKVLLTVQLSLAAVCVAQFARVVRQISRMQTALLTGWAPAFPATARPVDASRQGL